MKTLLLVSGVLAFSSALHGQAYPAPVPCDKVGKAIPKFVTRENYTFAGATLLAKYPDGLLFKVGTMAPPTAVGEGEKDCVMLVPEDALPEAIRNAVGGFNTAATVAAKKQRDEALEAGNKEPFPNGLTGELPVKDYYDKDTDPFGGKLDYGKAQTWEEFQAAKAKWAKQNEPEKLSLADQAAVAALAEARKQAIADPSDTEWAWGRGGNLDLRADGTTRHTEWKGKGRWKKNPDGTLVVMHGEKTYTVTFDENGVGQVVGGNKPTTIRLRSKKGPKEKASRLAPTDGK